jgi:hypothetical protein
MNKLAAIKDAIKSVGKAFTDEHSSASHIREVASLGSLAVPSVYDVTHKKKMGDKTKAALEVGGLGALAAPYALKLIKGH